MGRRRPDEWPARLARQLNLSLPAFEKPDWLGTKRGKGITPRRQGRRGCSLSAASRVNKDRSILRLSTTMRATAADGRSAPVTGQGGVSGRSEVADSLT